MNPISKFQLRKRMVQIGYFIQDLLVPPVCVHCQSRRWAQTPLCISCLKSLRPFHLGNWIELGFNSEVNRSFASARFLFPMSAALSSLVHGFKYRHLSRHIYFLCAYLRYRPDIIEFLGRCDGLVPVPIHPARRRERGYNQALLIAQAVSKLSGCPVINNGLVRIRYTESQTKLARQARGQNLQSAFKCNQPAKIAAKHLVLIDDVFTTGATADQCANLLKQSGAIRVDVFALGKVESNPIQGDFDLEMAAILGFRT